jgi:hypothetical protein
MRYILNGGFNIHGIFGGDGAGFKIKFYLRRAIQYKIYAVGYEKFLSCFNVSAC